MRTKRITGTTLVVPVLLCTTAGCLAVWPHTQEGIASWYGPGYHGRHTASGEVFDQEALTAAHKKLPFGTVVRVKNLRNGRTVQVRINDRGPFKRRRIIDLSKAAARRLDMIEDGIVPCRIKVIRRGG